MTLLLLDRGKKFGECGVVQKNRLLTVVIQVAVCMEVEVYLDIHKVEDYLDLHKMLSKMDGAKCHFRYDYYLS